MKIIGFFRQVFVVLIGCLLACFCLLFIVSSRLHPSGQTYKPQENTVLRLTLRGAVLEQLPVSLLGSKHQKMDFKVIKKSIFEAASDPCIQAIYLDVSGIEAGWAILGELRDALLTLKDNKKKIVAYADTYTQKSYYLASLADEIILNPSGHLALQGLSATVQFYTNLLKKIYIKPVIFRVGAYKSAVEPFSLTKMSNENRAQVGSYLNHVYDYFLSSVSASRGVSVGQLKGYANGLTAVLPQETLQAKLITKIGSDSDARAFLENSLVGDGGKKKKLTYVAYNYYYTAVKSKKHKKNRVAVVVAEGEIVDGISSFGYVGSRSFVKQLKAIERDDTIKAVVLRINSPGGSVLASDIMWDAIESLKKKKPIVASMANIAASGGYYIAMPCNYILAQPTTLTGSIGIFGLLLDCTELMGNMGVSQDVVKTADSADFLNPRTQFSDAENKFMQKMLNSSYASFLDKVAAGRAMKRSEVEQLASGRIFSGTHAMQSGLVDELGGLELAVAKAAKLAKLDAQFSLHYISRPTKFQILWSYLNSSHEIKLELLSMFLSEYPMIIKMLNQRKVAQLQARLPYNVDVA